MTGSDTDPEDGSKRIAVDVDGVLNAGGAAWWNDDHGTVESTQEEVVDWVNRKYTQGHTIFIHTSRPESVRSGTEEFLDDIGLRYHALVMDKLSADVYVDDKAWNPVTERNALREEAYPGGYPPDDYEDMP